MKYLLILFISAMAFGVGAQTKHLISFAHLEGDTDSTNANGDYSSDTANFVLLSTAGDFIDVNRMIVVINDTTIDDPDEYGKVAQLTNGIHVYVKNSADSILMTLTPDPIASNGEWGAYSGETSVGLAASVNYMVIEWTFEKHGAPIRLIGREGHKIVIELKDSFVGLAEHKFLFEGVYYGQGY